MDSLPQQLHQLVVLQMVEEPFDISLHYEVVLPPVQLVRQFTHRIVRSASRPIPIAAR